jgi:hypothetical protein
MLVTTSRLMASLGLAFVYAPIETNFMLALRSL